jgi:hypothetical protein
MPDENLLKYIKDGLAQGRTEDMLRPMLASAGWAQKDVDNAFSFVKTGQMPSAVAQPVAGRSISPGRFSGRIIGITIFVVCLLGAGSALAYYYVRSSLSPEQVLNKAFVAMQTVKTYSFSINSTSTVQIPTSSLTMIGSGNGSNGRVSLIANASGSMDISDLTDLKESLVVDVSASTGTTPTFGGKVEYIGLDNIYYVKIDEVNLGGPSSASNPITAMLQFFIGSWFKIDPVALQKTFAADVATSTLSQIQSSTQLSSEKIQQIKSIAAQYPIITVSKTLPDETIDGQDTYHYKLAINEDNLKSFIAAAYPVVSGQSLSSEQIASMTAAFNDLVVNDLEIWIGKKDFLVYKVSGDISVTQGNAGQSEEMQFSDLNSDYNQPVNIVAPDGAKDVAQIIGGFIGGFSKSTSSSKSK